MNGITSQMIFSPQNCTLERLESTLSPNRRSLAKQILARAEETTATGGSCNTLIVGPRGSGKTHLLHYVRRTLEKRRSDSGTKIIVLPEEARGMASLLDLLIYALTGAGMPRQSLLQALSGVKAPAAVEEARRLYRQATGGKPTFLIVENLDHLFETLGREALAELRGFLQEHASTSLLASSVTLFSESSHYDHPFYGFFTVHPLKPLDAQGAREYLGALAEASGDTQLASRLRRTSSQKRVNAIFHLTGGNHRLLAMLSAFLTIDGLDKLVEPFVQTVDRELTPYYQQRLDRLSPQQYRIVETVAEQQGRALTVKEIAHLSFLGETVVSRLLCDLRDAELLARTPVGRESYHELREPLLRLVLELKQGRDRPLPSVVNLLRSWYDAEELRRLKSNAADLARVYLDAAITPEQNEEPRTPAGMAVEATLDLDEKSQGGRHGERSPIQAQLTAAFSLIKSGRFGEALSSFEGVRTSAQESDEPEARVYMADALFWKSAALRALGRSMEAITALDELLARFSTSDSPEVMESVAKARIQKSRVLGEMGRSDEELSALGEVVTQFGMSRRPELQTQVATALFNKGVTLAQMNHWNEAISAYDELVARFGASDQAELREHVAEALLGKGLVLGKMQRFVEEVSTYDEMVRRLGTNNRPEIRKQLAKSMFNKGFALEQMGRYEEAISAYDAAVEICDTSKLPVLRKQVAQALGNKVLILAEMGRFKEATAVCDDVVSRFGTSDDSEVLRQVGNTLTNKSLALAADREFRQALAACDAALEIYPEHWGALVNKVLLLCDLDEPEAALNYAEQAMRVTDQPEARALCLSALLDHLPHRTGLLRRLRGRLNVEPLLWAAAVTLWVRRRVPIRDQDLRDREEAARNLREVFGDIAEVIKVVDMLEAAINYAKGDKRALLVLPLELRSLIAPDHSDAGISGPQS